MVETPPQLMMEDTRNGGRLPVPDPTVLTIQASEKAVAALKELTEARLIAIEKKLDRIEAGIDARPAAIIAEISHLQKLVEEKFKGVDQQFAGRDTALAAALLAQKTSVDEQNKSNALSAAKSETSVTKQIDGIQAIITSSAKGTDDKIEAVKELIGDVKDRVSTLETRALTVVNTEGLGREKARDSWNMGSILIGAAVGLGGLLLTIAFRVFSNAQ